MSTADDARAWATLVDALAAAVADRVAEQVITHMGQPRVAPAALRLEDAADYLGVSLNHVRRLIDRGQLEAVRLGGRVLIPRERLDALLRAA